MAPSSMDMEGKSTTENEVGSIELDMANSNKIHDDPMEIELTEISKDNKKVSLSLPMDLFPEILSYCPFSTLSKARCISMIFRDDFVPKESSFRHSNVDDSIKWTRKYATHRIIEQWWGDSLESTIDKAIKVAKNLFFETIPFLEGDEVEGVITYAKGYDETSVREALQKESVVLGENWRIEARHNLVPLSDAFREVKQVYGGRTSAMNLLMTAAPKKLVHIAECDVSIQQGPHESHLMAAYQVISFHSSDGRISVIISEANQYSRF
jgi:hypothetical protein